MQMNKSKIAFFGGTFDPIHLGHLFLLHQATQFTPFESIILSPVNINNFKLTKDSPATGEDRLEMVKLAILDYKELYPDDKISLLVNGDDIERGGVTYAYNSICNLIQKYTIQGKIGYFIGDDLLPTLHKWYKIEELLEKVDFYVFTREGYVPSPSFPIKLNLIPSLKYEQSSTEIRTSLSLEGLSRRVKEYVKAHKLYQA